MLRHERVELFLVLGVAQALEEVLELDLLLFQALVGSLEYYLTERGALGRGPADYEADLHFGFPINVGAGHIKLLADVFNVLNRQAANSLDLRYNRSVDPICAGVPSAICNGDGGILNLPGGVQPAGSIPDPKATSPNPDSLKAGNSFTNPRAIRLGARYTF